MPPTTHATLGASGSHRWMNCPGSIRLSEGLPSITSEHAREGTAAHDLLERSLSRGIDPDTWLGTEIQGVLVTEEMCEAVQACVEYVRSAMRPSTEMMLEKRFDLAPLDPPGPMFGTADIVLWDADSRLLEVVDYKHGVGVVVDAVENYQLRYYGIGAVLELNEKPDRIKLTIVQPRASHPDGIIRSEELTFEELVASKRHLFEKAEATTDPNAPLVVGDWCRFCKAQAICPAQKQFAVEVAQSEFAVFQPPRPETLTPEELATVLNAAPQLSTWLSAVQAHALNLLEQGEEVPGWKLVEGRAGNRKWKDEKEAEAELSRVLADVYAPPKLLSPAQVEKVAKSKGVEVKIDHLITRSPGRPILAPVEDARPALALSAPDEFDIPVEPSKRKTRRTRENG